MKSIILGEKVNGISKVEGIKYDVGEDYIPPKYILTDVEVPALEPSFGKNVYLGYDEENDKFVLIYEDRELTKDEKIEEQQQIIYSLKQELDKQETRTSDLEIILAEMLFS